jgi:perosamine synthetase
LKLTPSKEKIAFAGPWITDKELGYVKEATANGFYENFDLWIQRLEKTIAEYVGTKYAFATPNCTQALHASCAAIGLKEGDEVICPEISWAASSFCIAYTGATPVFVDVDPDTWCIDPSTIEAAITDKTKAIMVVHCFGVPADMSGVMAIAKKHGLRVIEDAAPAIGSEWEGKRCGSIGDFGCFSFHGAKLTVSGEGGAFVTDDKELYDKAFLWSHMGRTDSQAVFWCDFVGRKYCISNVCAALALAQIERVEELKARKQQISGWLQERLAQVEGIRWIGAKGNSVSNCCYPNILLEDSLPCDRDAVITGLRELNIHCRPAFPRMSRFPMMEQRFDNRVAATVERRGISLPSAANLTEAHIDFVATAVKHLIHEKP